MRTIMIVLLWAGIGQAQIVWPPVIMQNPPFSWEEQPVGSYLDPYHDEMVSVYLWTDGNGGWTHQFKMWGETVQWGPGSGVYIDGVPTMIGHARMPDWLLLLDPMLDTEPPYHETEFFKFIEAELDELMYQDMLDLIEDMKETIQPRSSFKYDEVFSGETVVMGDELDEDLDWAIIDQDGYWYAVVTDDNDNVVLMSGGFEAP